MRYLLYSFATQLVTHVHGGAGNHRALQNTGVLGLTLYHILIVRRLDEPPLLQFDHALHASQLVVAGLPALIAPWRLLGLPADFLALGLAALWVAGAGVVEKRSGTLAGLWRRGVGLCNLSRLTAPVVPLAGALGGRWEVASCDPLVASFSRGPKGLNLDPPGFPK